VERPPIGGTPTEFSKFLLQTNYNFFFIIVVEGHPYTRIFLGGEDYQGLFGRTGF